jgi:hypothetical protein
MATNSANMILAGSHAFQLEGEDFTKIDVIVQGHTTVGVRATKGDRREYRNVTFPQLERADSNLLIPIIDELAALVRQDR